MLLDPSANRREFLKHSTLTAGALVGSLAFANRIHAAGDDVLRLGLIGCGGRGSGAAANALRAALNVKLVAMADTFADQIEASHSAIMKEPEASDAYTALAMAYARKNNLADADLASAQAAFSRGDNKTARELAERAKQRFPIGSPGWVRADDIVAFNKNQKQNPLRPGQ